MKVKDFRLQGKMLVPKGEKVITCEGGWFTFVDEDYEGDINRLIKPYCYFCGFNEAIETHHIIRKCDGGDDSKDNLIDLCPNHHILIHKMKYVIGFSKGYYYLRRNTDLKIFKPFNKELIKKRKLPLKCINNNENLMISSNDTQTIIRVIKQGKKNNVKGVKVKGVKSNRC